MNWTSFYKHLDGLVVKIFRPDSAALTLWHHKAGPKTVFFWAPFWKWTIVLAGIADLARPAKNISKNNSASLVANGTIATKEILK